MDTKPTNRCPKFGCSHLPANIAHFMMLIVAAIRTVETADFSLARICALLRITPKMMANGLSVVDVQREFVIDAVMRVK